MTPEQKEQYSELEATAVALREEVEQARIQIDHLNREREEFMKEISGSQVSHGACLICYFFLIFTQLLFL